MFAEEEWTDGPTEQELTKSALQRQGLSDNKTFVAQGVGKKSLLRTLQALGSVPDWSGNGEGGCSDSEPEEAPLAAKKKKKRVRKRPLSDRTESSCTGKGKGPMDKKKKIESGHQKVGKPRVLGAGLGKGGNVIFPVPVEGEAGKEEGQCKLSRQQWRNKMKNKRKSKNKFCPNRETSPAKAEEKEGSESKEHSTTPSTTHPKVKSSKPKKGPETIGSKEKNETNKEELILVKKGSTSSRVAIKHGLKVKASDSQLAEDVINTLAQEDIRAKKRRQEVRRQQGRLQRLRRVLESDATLAARGSCAEEKREEGEEEKQEEVSPSQSVPGRSAALRARMELRLESARFRYINQQLYTSSSLEAQQLFRHDRQAFEIYHRGFTAQVQRWPSNPVDSIISYIHNKPASLVVADFGCGDCKIALSVRNKVHCFDLSPINNLVTVCDMANVPLQNDSVDIAVFCLSLMGTNISDFLVEANRVLVMRGVLKIAEVASRFQNVRGFINALSSLGFNLMSKDTENTYFYTFDFMKTGEPEWNTKKAGLELKPCVYKKR